MSPPSAIPLRASAARLRVEFLTRAEKLPKPQRELLSYLELHPGSHNVAELEKLIAKASVASRALARQNLVRLTVEAVHSASGRIRAPHNLNFHQQSAFDQIRDALDRQPLSDVSARRCDRLRQNRSLSASHRSHAGAGPRRAAAGSGDRSDAGGRGTISPAFRGTGSRCCTPPFTIPSARRNGDASARAKRRSWSQHAPACLLPYATSD